MVLGLKGSHFAGAINHRSLAGSCGELSSPPLLHFHGGSLVLEVPSSHDLDFTLTGDQALCREGFWEGRETERLTRSLPHSFVYSFCVKDLPCARLCLSGNIVMNKTYKHLPSRCLCSNSSQTQTVVLFLAADQRQNVRQRDGCKPDIHTQESLPPDIPVSQRGGLGLGRCCQTSITLKKRLLFPLLSWVRMRLEGSLTNYTHL